MMPQITDALTGWNQMINLIKITQTVGSDGQVINIEMSVSFQGIIQPSEPAKLIVGQRGERVWVKYMIHTTSQVSLNDNDLITYNCKNYKVMGKNDYSLNGFYYYYLVEDYQ